VSRLVVNPRDTRPAPPVERVSVLSAGVRSPEPTEARTDANDVSSSLREFSYMAINTER